MNEVPRDKVHFSLYDLAISFTGLIFCLIFLVYPTLLENRANIAAAEEALKVNPFASLSIEAQSAYVLDVNTQKVLFEKNAEAALPLASLTKIMTAVASLEVASESTIITIESDDLTPEGDSGLFVNEKWRLGDLLALTLIESLNDGAYAAASSVGEIEGGVSSREEGRAVFVELMNRTARKLGLAQTYFLNPTGLDDTVGQAGAVGSARDVAHLMTYAVLKYPELMQHTGYGELKIESLSNLWHTAVNTNKSLDGIPVIIASKTGFTDLAGGNLVITFDAGIGRLITIAILHSSQEGRFEDAKELAWATLDYLAEY